MTCLFLFNMPIIAIVSLLNEANRKKAHLLNWQSQ